LDPNALEKLTRDELINRARELGAKRPELLTRPELRDEIIRLSVTESEEQRRARGWFGVARDLVASVVGQGLNLPDAADLIRGVNVFSPIPAPPVATVTLAEIYAAQGHLKKALDLLDEVLRKEPDHLAARQARERWAKMDPPGMVTVQAQATSEYPDAAALDLAAADFASGVNDVSPAVDAATAQPEAVDACTPEPATLESVSVPTLADVATEAAPDAGIAFGGEARASEHESGTYDHEVATSEGAVQTPARDVHEVATSEGAVQTPARDVHVTALYDLASAVPTNEARPADLRNPNLVTEDVPVATRAVGVQHASDDPEQDQLFLYRMADGSCWYHWCLTRASLMVKQPSPVTSVAQFMIHVVEIRPSWDGPVTNEQRIEVEGATGSRRLPLHAPGSELRLVLELVTENTPAVLAVAAEFFLPSSGVPELRFVPPASLGEQAFRDAGAAAVPQVLRAREQHATASS
jgi:hypothetical protein